MWEQMARYKKIKWCAFQSGLFSNSSYMYKEQNWIKISNIAKSNTCREHCMKLSNTGEDYRSSLIR